MDYLQPAEALRAIVRALEGEVLPSVEDRYARSQLWAVKGILQNLAGTLDEEAAGRTYPATEASLERFVHCFAPRRSSGEPEFGDDLAALATVMRDNLAASVATQESLHYHRALSGK